MRLPTDAIQITLTAPPPPRSAQSLDDVTLEATVRTSAARCPRSPALALETFLVSLPFLKIWFYTGYYSTNDGAHAEFSFAPLGTSNTKPSNRWAVTPTSTDDSSGSTTSIGIFPHRLWPGRYEQIFRHRRNGLHGINVGGSFPIDHQLNKLSVPVRIHFFFLERR